MLQLTLDRIKKLIPAEHILTIVNKDHLHFAAQDLSTQPQDTIIVQPYCRETASGILLSVLHAYMRDPNAFVAIFPSDHFIVEEDIFMEHIASGFIFAKQCPQYLVILGIAPEYPDVEYGWIEKGDVIFRHKNREIYRVRRFCEKPSGLNAFTLHREGCLWNTFVMIGSAITLLNLFRSQLPELYFSFQGIVPHLRTASEESVLQDIFLSLPALNFSHTVLEKVPDHMCVIQLDGVYWSDWGNERRIRYDAEKLNIELISSPRSSSY
jgi:mannose-1-phosphate guanylyltransferase